MFKAHKKLFIVIICILVVLSAAGGIGLKLYQVYQAKLAAQALARENDTQVSQDAYILSLDTFHQHAVDMIDDNSGYDIADYLAKLGMQTVDDIGKRPPMVEVTDENRNSIAKIENVSISKEAGNIEVSITSEVLPISDDGYYYLFSKPIYQDKISGEPITRAEKDIEFTISCYLNYNASNSRLFDKFCVALLMEGQYVQVSNEMFITNPEARARHSTSRLGGDSKKGLLVDPVMLNSGQLTDLGVKHGAYNVFLSKILGGTTNAFYPTIGYSYNGRSYSFNGEMISMYDTVFSSLTNQGIDVNAIIINDLSNSTITYPASRGSSATLYAFNVADEEGVDYVAAVATFLAERYSGGAGHGKVVNWIIGNEVNERAIYNYTPYMGLNEYAKLYADTVRVFYNAMLAVNSSSRIFISLDQRWNFNSSDQSYYDGRDLLDAFNSYIKTQGNFDWNMGFHPYNYPLTAAKAWDLGAYNKYVVNSADTPAITIRNIHVLTDYLCQESYRNTSGGVRHVILSEMGYTSFFGQDLQAASYAYAYKIMVNNKYIDYMLMSRQTDAGIEVADKLATGINTSGYGQKAIYNVFKFIGTNRESEFVDRYLNVIGIGSWSEAVQNPR